MLTKQGCQHRRERLWQQVPNNVEWLLIADPRHVQYLANFWVQPLSFSGGERGLLLLERDNGATLLGDNFAIRSAAREPCIDREVLEGWYDHRHSVTNRDRALFQALYSISDRLKNRKGLLETEWLPVAAAEQLGFPSREKQEIELGTILRSLRRQKEEDEIELLKQCMRAGNAGHARAREVIQPGITEFDLFREVQQAAIKALGRPGLVYGDFRATTAENPKAGGLSTDYELQEGDLFILDYSVVLDGYRSDFTNTYAVGTPSSEQRNLFSHAEAAMKNAESKLKAGVPAKEIYQAASEKLELAGHGPLAHHAGHGLGLAHPEAPILVPESEDVLQKGDVITLEPGIYVKGIGGIRIEHNYLITENGYECLSNHEIALE